MLRCSRAVNPWSSGAQQLHHSSRISRPRSLAAEIAFSLQLVRYAMEAWTTHGVPWRPMPSQRPPHLTTVPGSRLGAQTKVGLALQKVGELGGVLPHVTACAASTCSSSEGVSVGVGVSSPLTGVPGCQYSCQGAGTGVSQASAGVGSQSLVGVGIRRRPRPVGELQRHERERLAGTATCQCFFHCVSNPMPGRWPRGEPNWSRMWWPLLDQPPFFLRPRTPPLTWWCRRLQNGM